MPTLQQLKEERLKKIAKMKELGWDPYPAHFEKKQMIGESRDMDGKNVQTAGKLMSFRTHGNIAFADIKDESGKIQLFIKKDVLGASTYKNLSLLDLGDYIGVTGTVGKTTAGEISIVIDSFQVLSKSLLPLPHEWFGLKDVESRYRQRYVDLLLNEDVRKRFNMRSRLVSAVRAYLDGLGFWEVETPILQPLYGGANAKPFTTHFNALDQKMYLRIAPELYLKRLIAGGYERVYEIAKDFRNEGIDHSHNPEFTMIEWYEAYANYHRMMDVTEGMFKHIAQSLYGNTIMQVEDKKIDIGGKWPRIEMSTILKEKLGLLVETSSVQDLVEYCKKNNIELIGGESKGQLIFVIFEHTIPQLLVEPTWIIDYPEEVSPLCKSHRTKKGWVERFEGYIGGKEICDGWSELNDPVIQRERFKSDVNAVRKDKEEAQQLDEDYLTAMEYGMPPIGGIGIGIDRLTMFFTNTWAIKETILFPTLRVKNKETKEETVQNHNNTTSHPVVVQTPTHQKKNYQPIDRKLLLSIVNEHIQNKNLVKHCLAAEAVMRSLAKKLGEPEDRWGALGLIHDADWEVTAKDHANHAKLTVQWLQETGFNDDEILAAILAHNYTYTNSPPPSTSIAWGLYCCDDLTGLIVASALVTPDKKLASLTVESVIKKFKSKSFAASVARDQILLCTEKLGIPFEEFVRIALKAMQEISGELGL